MILALLQGGELGYGATAVVLRAAYYTGSLGGAGLAFFALLFGARLDEGDARRLRRWATGASLLAIVSAIGALTAHVGVLMGGDTITDPEGWSIVLMSPAGASYALGGIGMVLVATLAFSMSWTPMAAAAGGVLACASYALLGHTTSLVQRPLLAGMLLVHLVVAAYWVGSLPPLAWVSRRDGPQAEPPRVWWRPQSLRGWGHDQEDIEPVFA